MIKINELRIGNFVYAYHAGEPKEVTYISQIGENNFMVKCYENYIDFQDGGNTQQVVSIPLTEEWLLKFGFVKDTIATSYWKKEDYEFFYFPGEIYLVNEQPGEDNDSYRIGSIFKYVHQLQNLYFVLTGEELKQTN